MVNKEKVPCPDCQGSLSRLSVHSMKGDIHIGYYCPACTGKDGGMERIYRARDMERLVPIHSVRVVDNQRDFFHVDKMLSVNQDQHIKAISPPLKK